jgi:hypothetical protein
MTGRIGLTWVTALTVASLLLGGGAINALAEGRDGGHRGGGGQGNSGHQQQQQQQKHAVSHQDDDKPQSGAQPTTKHDDGDVERGNNDGNNNDKDDLVTKPARVTDDVRPDKNCDGECNNHDDGEDMNTGAVGTADDN